MIDIRGVENECLISGCTNQRNEGTFVGNLCSPCFKYLANKEGENSQAFRNEQSLKNLQKSLRQAIIKLKVFEEMT